VNSPSKFDEYFEKVLRENMTAASAGVGATGTQFSGDTYAPGDARIPTVIGSKKLKEGKKKKQIKARKCPQGFMGSASQPHSTKKGKKGYKRREKHQDGELYDSKIPMIRRPKIAM
jgi:hypothetical protein